MAINMNVNNLYLLYLL